MRFKQLAELKRPDLREYPLGTLPQTVTMTDYAKEKAFRINELVGIVHGDSLEWYGFTLASTDNPGLITDIGLPHNDLNLPSYTVLSPERIAAFQESLAADAIINGWIHSHGALTYQNFSQTDEHNHQVVLDFVGSNLKRPVRKREIAINDLVLLTENQWQEEDMARGSVCLITDVPVQSATLLESVLGSFCYAIVIGDDGWHQQQIHYREWGLLSGRVALSHRVARIALIETGKRLASWEVESLKAEVEAKIRPNTNPPVENMERM